MVYWTIADCRRSLHEMANQFTISLISQAGHHQASPTRRGKCRYAHGYLQAKHKKPLQHTSQHPLAKRTTVSHLSPDMACDKQQKNTETLRKPLHRRSYRNIGD